MTESIIYSKEKLTKREAHIILDRFHTLIKHLPNEGCFIATIFDINYCRNFHVENDLMIQAARFLGELSSNSCYELHLHDISRGKFIKIERTKEEN